MYIQKLCLDEAPGPVKMGAEGSIVLGKNLDELVFREALWYIAQLNRPCGTVFGEHSYSVGSHQWGRRIVNPQRKVFLLFIRLNTALCRSFIEKPDKEVVFRGYYLLCRVGFDSVDDTVDIVSFWEVVDTDSAVERR